MFFQIILLQIVLFILNNIFLVSYKFRAFEDIPISIVARDASVLMVCLPCLMHIAYMRIYAFQPDFEYEQQTAFVFFVSFLVHAIASGLTTSGNRDLSGVMPSLVVYAVCLVSIYTVEQDNIVIRLSLWALISYLSMVIICGIIFGIFKKQYKGLFHVVYMILVYTGLTYLIVDEFYKKNMLDIKFIAIISAFFSLFYPLSDKTNEVNAVLVQLKPLIQTRALGGSILNQIEDVQEPPQAKISEEEIDNWIREVVSEKDDEVAPPKEEVKSKPKIVIKKNVNNGNTKFIKKKF